MRAACPAPLTGVDNLKLTGGIRYTQDKQDYEGCSRDFNGNMLPNVNVVNRALFFPAYGPVAPISQGQCNTFDPATRTFGPVISQLDEDNVAWRLALDWTPSDGILVFGSVSRGAKAGATPINADQSNRRNAEARRVIGSSQGSEIPNSVTSFFDRDTLVLLGICVDARSPVFSDNLADFDQILKCREHDIIPGWRKFSDHLIRD